MERVVILARLSLWALSVLVLLHGAQGARILSAHVQSKLPPCQFNWQVPGWDCFDPPQKALPSCDFKHQRPGFDCWPKDPPAAKATVTGISATVGASTHDQRTTETAHRVQGMLPPCKDVWGGIPGWDCFDPPSGPLPPCDFKHQRPGFDCWPKDPPAGKVTVTEISATGGASTHDQRTTESAHHVQGMLPPCKDVPGGIPGWDCFDPPSGPLPPCDFKHQRPGFDCWPKDPPAGKVTVTEISATGGASTHDQRTTETAHRVQGMLPPCKDVWGGIPGWDCFDPPSGPLPPCDFKHQRPGFDCWPKDPPAGKVTVTEISATGGASTHDQRTTESAHHVQGMLPPCKDVPGGIPGWDCFDPPSGPLPPCDFKHQRPGFDCWPKDPPAGKVTVTEISATGGASTHDQRTTESAHHVQGMLPPCKDVPGGIPGWDCFDPPSGPLPPCDFKHQRPGFDCWPKDPPAGKVTVTEISATGGASTHDQRTTETAHRVQGMLPPCKDVWGGIPGWDCFDPPSGPLPPCDFKHQRPGFDCWPKDPPAGKVTVTEISATGGASTHDQRTTETAHRVQGMLPPCKDVWGGIPGWDCFDPPSGPLPPCDFKHQRPGFDCWPKDPPAGKVTVTEISATGGASTHDQRTTESAHHVQGMLPPCKDVPGGIPGWDCFDPPSGPLPPCDFKHQRPGFDCWPKDPPAGKVTVTEISATGGASTHDQRTTETVHHVQGMLPPCKDVWGGIPGWDCFDPPSGPLPPCDFKHQRPGFDCWPKDPPAGKVTVTEISATGGASTHDQRTTETAHRVQGMLPPCKDVWGGIPGWDCFDPPSGPLPPCDFKHQRPGFDCWPKDPPAAKATVTGISATVGASTHDQRTTESAHHVQGMLPPCKDVPGGIPGWDCFDPPSGPLPPCDFKHQRPGFDCWPKDPPAAP